MKDRLTVSLCLPNDHERAVLVGRVFMAALKDRARSRQADGVRPLDRRRHIEPVAQSRQSRGGRPRGGTLPRRASAADVLANSASDAATRRSHGCSRRAISRR
jgi:hypothetical protein